MHRTEFIPLKDMFPRFVDCFMTYGPTGIFSLVGVVLVVLSIKGVVAFEHIFWLAPVVSVGALFVLVLMWFVLEVLFLGLRYTWRLTVCGTIEAWEEKGAADIFVYPHTVLLLLVLMSLAAFLYHLFGGV